MINELQLQLTDVHPQGLVEIEQNLLKTEFESDDDVFTQNQSLRRTRPTTQELDDLESENSSIRADIHHRDPVPQ